MEPNIEIGSRVEVEGEKGTVRYVGSVATSKKAETRWVGIEWDNEGRGKHDGSVTTNDNQTHRYFTCKPGMASFLKPLKCNFGKDLISGIQGNLMTFFCQKKNKIKKTKQNKTKPAKFNTDSLEDDLKEQEAIARESNYKVEFVGWKSSIQRQCDLKNKRWIVLERQDISYIDITKLNDLGELIPIAETMG